MRDAESGGAGGRRAGVGVGVASVSCLVAVGGLLALAWRLGWWTPADGSGRLTARALVAGAVFLPVGLVTLFAWLRQRR
ncbi:hypothetical protein K2224_07305 [Streptomyces sp. BHT-5-2]|uniref:hypothetical protein n=1 Tax=unclassified Streptomyces TaxID=2593676 RepID=UPI001C8E19E1|nr:hypothetical protein [Streptomyces sp. BHT-5-2]QZL03052.1 hypothetical protein K2224_07305 [Streptomyces sp. BHT-5-2]